MARWGFLLYFIFVFFTGWMFHAVYVNNFVNPSTLIPDYKELDDGKEEPLSSGSTLIDFFMGVSERNSPKDRISEQQINVYDDRIIINLDNAEWSSFADTNSMDPFIDKGANGIEIKPKSAYDIQVGDVISYNYEGSLIIHRVVEINQDKSGIYYLTKGDNNVAKDPVKVRFEQVNGVLVGVLY